MDQQILWFNYHSTHPLQRAPHILKSRNQDGSYQLINSTSPLRDLKPEARYQCVINRETGRIIERHGHTILRYVWETCSFGLKYFYYNVLSNIFYILYGLFIERFHHYFLAP